jgi:hypothetical protein
MRLVVWYYLATPLFLLGDALWGWSVRVAFLDQFRAGRYAYYALCWIVGFIAWRAPRYASRLALLECSANLGLLILSVFAWYLQVLDWAGSERVAVEVPGVPALVNFVLVAAVGALTYSVQRARLAAHG